jgi:poly(3-hydroxybutyrate) depolymerase
MRLSYAVLTLTLALAACSSSSSPTAKPLAPADSGASVDAGIPEDLDAGVDAGDAMPRAPEWVAPVVATRSAACGRARVNTQGETFVTSATSMAPNRKFHVYTPTNYDPNKAYPVALTFSGWMTNGAAFREWFKMDQAVGNSGITVYPDMDGALWDQVGQQDLLFFDEMVKQLSETFCINPSRMLGMGFSQGGIFMSQLGCYRAGYVKAIAIGAGSKAAPTVGCGRLPALLVSRTRDPDERIEWGYENKDLWAVRNQCSTNTMVSDQAMNCITHQGCRAPGSVTFCEDTFFDPTWPSDWNHTMRGEYRQYAWDWFMRL